MTAMEHAQSIAIFQQLYAVEGAHSSSAYGTLRVNGRQKVQYRHDAHTVVFIVVERPGQYVVLCLIVVMRSAVQIRDLNYPRLDLLVQIVLKDQVVSLYGLSDVIRYTRLVLKGFI